jgi:hypothetical protein
MSTLPFSNEQLSLVEQRASPVDDRTLRIFLGESPCLTSRRNPRISTVIFVAVVAATALVMALAGPWSRHWGLGNSWLGVDLGTQQLRESLEFCGHVDRDTEYHTQETLYWINDIFSEEMCCALCDGDPSCGAWTFGKAKNVSGMSKHCNLLKLHKGENPIKYNRPGMVSGIRHTEIRKHGIVAELLSKDTGNTNHVSNVTNTTCPGKVNITGLRELSVRSALWYKPKMQGNPVQVPDGNWGVFPQYNSRAYFSDSCVEGEVNSEMYAALKLLGTTIQYTVDLSGLGCGCNAQFHLVTMRYNSDASQCGDYCCGAAQVKQCGVSCPTISLQDANQYAWSTSVHLSNDADGKSVGYGGGSEKPGRRHWSDAEYGPQAKCIDTTWPFRVSVSFKEKFAGMLDRIEVTLSQEDRHDCTLKESITEYNFKKESGLAEFSRILEKGVTPMLSYSGGEDMTWLDGVGADGKGPCVRDVPKMCPQSVKFYDFEVTRHEVVPKVSGDILLNALGVIHADQERHAMDERKDRLHNITHMEAGISTDCVDDCAPMKIEATDGEYVEDRQGNEEWEIVATEVQVRATPSFRGIVLGLLPQGVVLFGQRSGDWIKLTFDRGYVAILRKEEYSTSFFLERRVVSYEKLTEGNCVGAGLFPINGNLACKAAAFALGYFDRTINTYDGTERPEGCYVKDGQLWIGDRGNKGNGAMHGAEPICGSMAYPTSTTTTTTTTTSTKLVTTSTSTKSTTTTTTWDFPSFFCVTLMRADGHELEILKKQLFRRTGVFACEEYAIYSDHSSPQQVGVAPDGSEIRSVVIPPITQQINNLQGGSPCVGTQTMLNVWDMVHKDGRYKRHQWVLKVDPTAVFLPDRLKDKVKKQSDLAERSGFFVTTCERFNTIAPSLEVFSVHALSKFYGRNQWQCTVDQIQQFPCEESFMTQCMDVLGAKRLTGLQLAGDPHCEAAPCTDDKRALFTNHFQDPAEWFKCFNEAIH